MKKIFFGIVFVILSGCMGMPENITPVEDFILEKYLGKWYEIARMDHSFERGLNNVTAFYSIREQGGISVKNRGYSADAKSWREAEGKAYFAGNNNEGAAGTLPHIAILFILLPPAFVNEPPKIKVD